MSDQPTQSDTLPSGSVPSDNVPSAYDKAFVNNMVESALRIGLLFLLLLFTFDIVRPFIGALLWGAIIAMAAMPLTHKLEVTLGGRRGLSATLVTLVGVLFVVVPLVLLMDSMIGPVKSLATVLSEGDIHIPPPPEGVASWPFIGEKLDQFWSLASTNFEVALKKIEPELNSVALRLLSMVGGGIVGALLFIVSLLIAGVMMAYAEGAETVAKQFAVRVAGEQGADWAALCTSTVRNVLQGVVGVAVIQTALVAIGLFAIKVPAAGLWTAIVLILAVAQLPPTLILAPIIIYVFTYAETTPAVIFTIWSLVAGSSDTFLKPLLMGRGLDIPMPVILLGAIGGMISSGIIGLFIGAVVLAIWYKLFMAWISRDEPA